MCLSEGCEGIAALSITGTHLTKELQFSTLARCDASIGNISPKPEIDAPLAHTYSSAMLPDGLICFVPRLADRGPLFGCF